MTNLLDQPEPIRDAPPRSTKDVGERLRTLILSGELPPGTILSQVELARTLGVSTTPVREAIRVLQAEGLLEAERNRRVRIAPVDVRDLDAVYSARVLLEAVGIALTARGMSGADAAALKENLARLRHAADERDLVAWEVAHMEFHRRVVADVNPSQAQLIASLFDRSERYRRMSVLGSNPRAWTEANAEHERIARACIERNPIAAARELARHLARTALNLAAQVAPEAEAAAVRTAVQIVSCWTAAAGPDGGGP